VSTARPPALDELLAFVAAEAADPPQTRDIIVRGASAEQVAQAIDEARRICPDLIFGATTGAGDAWYAGVQMTLPRSTWKALDAAQRAKGGAT